MTAQNPDSANAPRKPKATGLDAPVEQVSPPDIDPAATAPEEDDEALLPDLSEDGAEAVAEGPLASGHAAIENAVRLAPTSPGVYRMLNAASDVLYVGKAKNVKKRLSSYARVNAPLPARILRMIAATVTVEIISTTTETEALLLEANLIKQLHVEARPQLLDQVGFQQQRFGLGGGRDDLDIGGCRDHAQDARRLRRIHPRIGRQPFADVLGLADIEHVVGRV